MKVIVKLMGGLGNQMFQYAFGYTLSKEYGAELYGISPKFPLLMHQIFHIGFPEERLIWSDRIKERPNQNYADNKLDNFLNLKDGHYLIDGYWQHENYFKKYKEDIKKIYTLPKFYVPDNDLVIHVRRGDYVNSPSVRRAHFVCDLNWYKKAISHFNFNRLHIVSDDINWCRINFAEYEPVTPSLEELDTLGYISSFNNIIISNSSFGWWGAYLSDSHNVIYPSVWMPKKPKLSPGLSIWKSL